VRFAMESSSPPMPAAFRLRMSRFQFQCVYLGQTLVLIIRKANRHFNLGFAPRCYIDPDSGLNTNKSLALHFRYHFSPRC